MQPAGGLGHKSLRQVVVAVLVAGLIVLTVLTLANQRAILSETERSARQARIAAVYQDARFWVGQEESLERKYRLEPSAAVFKLHDQAERRVGADLRGVLALDGSSATRSFVERALRDNGSYADATQRMFSAVVLDNGPRVRFLDHVVTDPIFTSLETAVDKRAARSAERARESTEVLRRDEATASLQEMVGVAVILVLFGALSSALRRGRRARVAMRAAELERLEQLVITDPLTGLRNHRAFQEDLATELQRTGRTGVPTALVMLDADDLKTINDTHGHQAGDETLVKLARALVATPRGADRAYRIGGDEFAVILHDAGEWAAFEFAQRLLATLSPGDGRDGVQATAGIAQALSLRTRDALVREADLALMNAKRFDQDVAIYTPEMTPFRESALEAQEDQQTRKLARALALAVDSKDSYTRSHSQTVATLCAVLGAELGIEGARLKQIRLAGLLHDVGKIGIPDSILKKPGKLTDKEYAEMKRHPQLGGEIILAAEMPVEARWVRHHHERIDGHGYPDGLSGREIPLESRIIHVADAFEAMTSDRPYRDAPGELFAIEELKRHAGTQFDAEVVEGMLRVLNSSHARVPGEETPSGDLEDHVPLRPPATV